MDSFKSIVYNIFLCSAENILVRPVYDDGSDERLRGKTATECLKIHCDDLSKRIHGEDSVTCDNNAGYSLFILYTGHGHDKEHAGYWCPTKNDVISKEEIDGYLNSLYKCIRSLSGQEGECKAACK